jgi:uncharacterized damage-inducible protein DinB
MSETHQTSELLAPELQTEIAITRRILAAVPDGHNDFKPHDKSMTLARLAAHVAELPSFAAITLTSADFDLAVPNCHKPHVFETSAQNVAAFDSIAADALVTVNATSDEKFNEPWSLVWGDYVIFKGTRYSAFRAMAMNHVIHHRAQLGVYLRLLGVAVPKTYGPSADEQ